MGYDSRCYDLAALFLSDNPDKNTEANRDELAQHIQDEIESWIEYILKPKEDAALSVARERKAKEDRQIYEKMTPAEQRQHWPADPFINDYD